MMSLRWRSWRRPDSGFDWPHHRRVRPAMVARAQRHRQTAVSHRLDHSLFNVGSAHRFPSMTPRPFRALRAGPAGQRALLLLH